MNQQPIISVIIPVFNREKFIKNCLDIMMNQTYKNLEIIVVNDGSSDGSMDIIKKYPVTVIEHEKNKGLSAARNTGLDNAHGKYIHFMDDDDQINISFYENLVKAAEDSNADMTASGMISQKTIHKIQLFDKVTEHNSLQERLTATYVGKWGYVWRYLFRLDFIQNNNLRFEEGRLIEDLPFSFAAVYYANKIVTVPHAEYLYVYNEDSIINTKNKEMRERRHRDSQHAKDFVTNFAKEHGNFPIPGVTVAKWKYVLRKVKLTINTPRKTLIDK